ncbi:hypothetical protein [Bradyrhizobium sp. 139]|uniref:hypothetical protein n=1 Tax=Bradyrhizobium sp. 139 TaxID=2782616 RepID=UPI001FFB1B8F|nr:hypothetical protein [Bradyrhizobium sp. 139]
MGGCDRGAPRNAKFTNPPYRAYIRNPELAPKLSMTLITMQAEAPNDSVPPLAAK